MQQGDALEVKRIEHKYSISAAQAAQLQGVLARSLMPDANNGPCGYRVKSLYFDTWDDDDFWEKDAGILNRKKLRLRLYSEEDTLVKLECKQKAGDYQRKLSLPVSRDASEELILGNPSPLLQAQSPKAQELYWQLIRRRPVGMVEYWRTAFCWPAHNVRITLDRQVRYAAADGRLFEQHLPYRDLMDISTVILEVKYDLVLEPYIRELVQPYCGNRLSWGKYDHARRCGF